MTPIASNAGFRNDPASGVNCADAGPTSALDRGFTPAIDDPSVCAEKVVGANDSTGSALSTG